MDINQTKQLLALRRGQACPERSGDYWGKDTLEQLKFDFSVVGLGISELALKYGRTEHSIYQQLLRSGLLEPQCQVKRCRKEKTSVCLCQKCLEQGCPSRREAYKDVGRV